MRPVYVVIGPDAATLLIGSLGLTVIERFLRSLRTKGIWPTIASATRAAASLVVRTDTERVLAKDLTSEAETVRSANLEMVLVSGAGSPLPATLPAAWSGDRKLMSVFRSYLANGFGGVFAQIDGAAVGYLWWTKRTGPSRTNHPHLVRYGIELANDDLWIFDLNMLREHRRSSSEFLTRAEGLARDHGFRRILFCVAANNRPALWLYHRWGWKTIDSIRSIEVFRCLMISPQGLFVRNGPWSRQQNFDYRALWRSKRARATVPAGAAPVEDDRPLPSLPRHL